MQARFSEAIDMIQGGSAIHEVVKAGTLTVEQAELLLPVYKKFLANRHLLKLDTDAAIKEAVLRELSGPGRRRKPLYPHVPKIKKTLYPHHESNPDICQDIKEKLKATKQIYLPDVDMPLSITKGLFSLLDAERRAVAKARGIPEVQYDFEDILFELLGRGQ